jgi:DnaK suppressor protein
MTAASSRRTLRRSAYHAAVDPEHLTAFRDALLAGRTRLHDELIETEPEAPGQMTYGSQASAASQVFAQQRDLALHERAERHLQQIEAAIIRLDDGTFGTCLSCGRAIAEERLEALPWAALCIECQRQADR